MAPHPIRLVVAAFFSVLSAAIASAAPLFVPAPALPITVARGSGPVLLGDINHDGHLDLVTKHLTNRAVTVLLGDGQGHFLPPLAGPMQFDFEPAWIALGYVSNGSIAIMAVANKDERHEIVRTYLASTNLSFSPTPTSSFSVDDSERGYKPWLQFTDLNEDGNADLLSANGRRNAVYVYLGNGQGGFSPGATVELESGTNIHTFAVGDMDGDGHLDLVSTTASGTPNGKLGRVTIRYGNGKGVFTRAHLFSVPPDPSVGTLVDVNGDGRLDIVLNHGRSKKLTILLNDGRGGFVPRAGPSLEVTHSAYAVLSADVNGDKRADLIVATVNDSSSSFESNIEVLLGDGKGDFAPAPGSPFPAAPGAYSLACGDINEDGKLDIVASSFESNTITVLLGK
jgi:hypothetical protein